MFPVGFLLQFDTKVLRCESVFIIIILIIICHLWYRFSIHTEVLHSGIIPKPKLWYWSIPTTNTNHTDTEEKYSNINYDFDLNY